MQTTVSKWKEWAAKSLKIEWQRDFFEHRLRKEESLRRKGGLYSRKSSPSWVGQKNRRLAIRVHRRSLVGTARCAVRRVSQNVKAIADAAARRPYQLFPHLICERAGVIDFPQRFGDGGGIDAHGARLFVGVNAIEDERLNVAVENDADKFVRLVHDRAAAVAADDVGGGDEVVGRG